MEELSNILNYFCDKNLALDNSRTKILRVSNVNKR